MIGKNSALWPEDTQTIKLFVRLGRRINRLKSLCLAACTAAVLAPSVVAAQTLPEGGFTLTTLFRESEDECFEGNQIDGALNGVAFMDRCQSVTGQMWQATPAGNGYYRLTTLFRAPFNECLEGNKIGGNLNGAAFMDRCQDVSGQLWRVIPAKDGYFRLTTLFREPFNECLEGNQVNGANGGGAFMDRCQNVSGQLWRALPLPD